MTVFDHLATCWGYEGTAWARSLTPCRRGLRVEVEQRSPSTVTEYLSHKGGPFLNSPHGDNGGSPPRYSSLSVVILNTKGCTEDKRTDRIYCTLLDDPSSGVITRRHRIHPGWYFCVTLNVPSTCEMKPRTAKSRSTQRGRGKRRGRWLPDSDAALRSQSYRFSTSYRRLACPQKQISF